MKIPLMLFLIIITFIAFNPASGQDGVKKRVPIMVSHLSEDNKAILRRKEAPRHYFLTKIFCFKKKCRAYIGWRKRQRAQRFKGYKDGGKISRPLKPKPVSAPPVRKDTVIVQPVDPIVHVDTIAMAKQVFVLDEVLFEVNSAHFNERFIYRLDSLVKLLEDHPKVSAAISGHTDNTGKESHNLKLSKDRAQAVAIYLTKNNIEKDRISFEGWGSSKPIAGNGTEEGRRKNRRVEILISE
jgi:outer membrane protein OmpA-like peptidoglycan-associated protein